MSLLRNPSAKSYYKQESVQLQLLFDLPEYLKGHLAGTDTQKGTLKAAFGSTALSLRLLL